MFCKHIIGEITDNLSNGISSETGRSFHSQKKTIVRSQERKFKKEIRNNFKKINERFFFVFLMRSLEFCKRHFPTCMGAQNIQYSQKLFYVTWVEQNTSICFHTIQIYRVDAKVDR